MERAYYCCSVQFANSAQNHSKRHRFVRAMAHAAVLSLLVMPIHAHHSNVIYDVERSVTITGVVARYEWRNPHVYLYVTTEDENGETAVWKIESSPPALMARRGWSRATFMAGDRVSVEVSPARIASKRMGLVRSVRKADGTILVVNSNDPTTRDQALATPPAPVPAPDLSGTWLTLVTPGGPGRQFVFGPTSWPLTAKGAAAVKEYDDSTNPAANCVAYTAPFTMVLPDMKRIEIGEEVTTIRSSLESAERIVHMRINSHDGAPFSNQGHSIGRWEGQALVVDTTHYTARLNGNAFKLPSSCQKHLVERYELSEDRSRLVYTLELEDPEYIAEPLTGEVQWAYNPDGEFAAEGCDLENARQYLEGFDN